MVGARPGCAFQCQVLEQLLVVLLYGLDGDDRTRTTAPPSGHGGARDGHVLRQAAGADTDHVVPKTVVVRAAGPWRCRGHVYHHESITNLGSPSKKLSDIGAVEVAYTFVRKVCAHSWADIPLIDDRGQVVTVGREGPIGEECDSRDGEPAGRHTLVGACPVVIDQPVHRAEYRDTSARGDAEGKNPIASLSPSGPEFGVGIHEGIGACEVGQPSPIGHVDGRWRERTGRRPLRRIVTGHRETRWYKHPGYG